MTLGETAVGWAVEEFPEWGVRCPPLQKDLLRA